MSWYIGPRIRLAFGISMKQARSNKGRKRKAPANSEPGDLARPAAVERGSVHSGSSALGVSGFNTSRFGSSGRTHAAAERKDSGPDFRNFEHGMERWVRIKPPEIGAVLAVRAALRAIPALDTLNVNFQPIALQTFRASAIGWAACRYRTGATALAQSAMSAANNVFDAAREADRLRAFSTATVARVAGDAALAAVDSQLDRTLSDPKAISAIKAATDIAIASIFDDDPSDSNRAAAIRMSSTVAGVIDDFHTLETGTTASTLASKPLWLIEFPIWANEAWLRLRDTLLNMGEDWDVWVDWYERRLRGSPATEPVELAIANIDNSVWSQGPEIANAHVKQLIRINDLDPNDDEALQEWLASKPSEWGSVIIARVGLRVLPFGQHKSRKEMLSVFRAAAAARYAVAHPEDKLARRHLGDALGQEGVSDAAPLDEISSSVIARESAAAVFTEDTADVVRVIGLAIDFTTMQDAIRRDAQDLQNGVPAQRLLRAPLWRSDSDENVPSEVTGEVTQFSASLRRFGSHWEVWMSWYDYVLSGSPPAAEREDTWEAAYGDWADPLPWDEGAEAVNTKIAERFSIPPQRPAAIEPVWRKNVLVLPSRPTKIDLDARKFAAALKVLRTELSIFAKEISGEANIDRRFISYVQSFTNRIPKRTPRQSELFQLGHTVEVFASYSKIVEAEWPEFLAAKYHALSLNFERVMRQSPLWREFKRNAEQQSLTPEQVIEAPNLAAQLANALRDADAQEFIDPAVPDALDELAASEPVEREGNEPATENAESVKELHAIDVIESINNILKRLAERAVAIRGVVSQSAKGYAAGLAKELPKASAKLGHEHGSRLPKWLFRLATGGSVIGYIASHFSDRFAWLIEHVIPLLSK
jgi:hypothetical protein